MVRIHPLKTSLLGLSAVAAILGLVRLAVGQGVTLPAHPVSSVTPLSLLTQDVPDSMPDAEQVRRGQALVIAGDCLSCHLRAGGEPFSGGLGLSS